MAEGDNYSKISLYKVEGDSVVRARRACPQCGPGVFLAKHENRESCGRCGHTEFAEGAGPKQPGQVRKVTIRKQVPKPKMERKPKPEPEGEEGEEGAEGDAEESEGEDGDSKESEGSDEGDGSEKKE